MRGMSFPASIQTRAQFESPREGTDSFYRAIARIAFKFAAGGAAVGGIVTTLSHLIAGDPALFDIPLALTALGVAAFSWRESRKPRPRIAALLVVVLSLASTRLLTDEQYNAVALLVPIIVIGLFAAFTLDDKQIRWYFPLYLGVLAAAMASYPVRFGADAAVQRGLVNVVISTGSGLFVLRLVRRQIVRYVDRFNTLYDDVAIGLIRLSAAGDVVACNNSFVRLLGAGSAEQVQGDSASNLAVSSAELQHVLDDIEGSGQTNLRLRRSDDTEIWVQADLREIRDHAGRLLGWDGFVRDISDERKAIETAREADARFSSAFDSTPVGLALVGDDGVVLSANQALGEIVGERSDSLQGRNWSELASGQLAECLNWDADGAHRELEIKNGSPKSRWVRFRSARPANEPGAGSYVVVQLADTTAEHDLAEFLREQVRSKNDFIAGVSHELRTPLTAVVGFAEELRRTLVDLPADKYEMIEIVSSQSTNLSHIVEDLLVAARAEIGELTIERVPVDVRSLVGRVVRSSRYLATDTASTVDVNCDDVSAAGDPVRVEQVVRNLVTNAMLHGGPSVKVRASGDGALVNIEVEDDGGGVPGGAEEEIFRAYRSIGRHTSLPSSIGLGLSVSTTLAQMMDGTLAYHRERNATIFRLSLPAHPEA